MDYNEYDIEARKARVKARLDAAIEEIALSEENGGRNRKRVWPYIAGAVSMAAAVLLAVVLKVIPAEDGGSVNWVEVLTAYGEKKSVLLPDGTIIWLHNESRLLYPSEFTGRTRQVFSSGEVFAEVAKDKKHPFILSSNNVNVRVKGTVFNFRSYPKSTEAELTLVEGAVDMDFMVSGIKQSVEIAPGQVVKADLENGKVTRTCMNPEKYVSWTVRNALYFNDETLQNIILELQRQFKIMVVVNNKNLLGRRFYASFVNDESPLDILKALCADGGMKVLQKEYHYSFTIGTDDIDINKHVTVQVKNVSIQNALDRIFAGQDVSYKVNGKNISVVAKKTQPAPAAKPVGKAQPLLCTGIVVDENNSPMAGAFVVEKGTTNAVSSGADGKFSIKVTGAEPVLSFSFFGYEDKEVQILSSRTNIEVKMEPQALSLDQSVVVGYGSMTRRDITSAIGQFKPKASERRDVLSVDQLLQGRIAGVNITTASGIPGASSRVWTSWILQAATF